MSKLRLLALGLLASGVAFSQGRVIPPSLPDGAVGSTYGFLALAGNHWSIPATGQQFTAAGGVAPYTFSIVNGGLPPGLSFDGKSGLLSGIPTQTGSSTFSVSATDSTGAVGNPSVFTIKVGPSFQDGATHGTVGATFNDPFSCFPINNGTPVTYNVMGPFPPGVSFDNAKASYKGIPTISGTYNSVFQCKAEFTLTVIEPLVILPQPAIALSPSATAGQAYDNKTLSSTPTFTAPNFTGAKPFTFSINAGTFPFALQLDPATGEIKGFVATPGTYTFDVRCTSPTPTGANPNTVATVTGQLTVTAGQVNASPPSLTLSGPAGGSSITKTVSVGGGVAVFVPFSVSTSTTDGQPWLTAAALSTTTPGDIQVAANPASLSPGPYSGTVTVSFPGGNPPPIIVPVTFTVQAAAPPALSSLPPALNFSLTQGGAPSTKILTVSNTGSGSVQVFLSPDSDGHWLSIPTAGGAIAPNAPMSLSVTADPSGLAAGTYSGTISFIGPGVNLSVPATLLVGATSPVISLSQSGLAFLGVQGRPAEAAQTLTVSNAGIGTLNFTASASPGSSSWLKVTPKSDSAAGSNGADLQISADPSQLQPGVYYGEVGVFALGAPNSPQVALVAFKVYPSGTDLDVRAVPPALLFVGGGSQKVTLTLDAQLTLIDSVDLKPDYGGGPPFFTYSPASGTVTSQGSFSVTVSAVTAGLGPGVHQGALLVRESDLVLDASPTFQSVGVVVVIPPASPGAPIERAAAAACTPKQLAPVVTSLGQNFSVSAGWPTPISVLVPDDCGGLNTAGAVSINFSNGDPPLVLKQQGDKSWTGTWVGGNGSSKVVLTVAATSVNPLLTGTTLITGTLLANPDPPLVSSGAVLNGASFALNGPLAPGSFVSLFGGHLADSQLSAPSVPLQPVLAGASLTIAGVPAPVFFASDGQVNAIIPYGIPVNTTQQVIASRDTSIAVPQNVAFAAAAPGIFMYGKNQGIIVNLGNALANSGNPVHTGDVIVIYCTGLGEVNPPVPAGTATPGTGLSHTINTVTLTVGGVSTHVDFAGLTPGSTGLYQVNSTVPAGVAPGDNVPVVLTAAGQSSAPVVISVR